MLSLLAILLLAILLAVNIQGLVINYRHYLSAGYLLPTSILHTGLLFYGVLPGIYLALNPKDAAFKFGRYDLASSHRIVLMYLVASLACLIVSWRTGKKPIPHVLVAKIREISRLYIIAFLGFIVTLWLFDRTWAVVGGIKGFLFSGISRLDLGTQVFSHSAYFFFNYYVLFKIFLAVYLIALFSDLAYHRRPRFLAYVGLAPGLLFATMNLLGGTRLLFFHLVIMATVATGFYVKIRFTRKGVVALVVIFLMMNFIGSKRKVIREWFGGEAVSWEDVWRGGLATALVPSEAFTGYIPAYIIFDSYTDYFVEPQYIKVIPSSIAKRLGINKNEHFSKRLALYGAHLKGQCVLTVPLPVDGYYGLNCSYLLLFLYALIVFGGLNLASRALLMRQSLTTLLLYLILMGLSWVYVRYDIARAFSRTWQSALFVIPIVIYFFLKLNKTISMPRLRSVRRGKPSQRPVPAGVPRSSQRVSSKMHTCQCPTILETTKCLK